MRTILWSQVWALALLMTALTSSAQSGFTGPYSLTPPAPGTYQVSDGGNYGAWAASLGMGTITTENAPNSLELAVPAGSIVPNDLTFQIHAAADGTVSFDSTVVDDFQGQINWLLQSPGGTLAEVPLDDGLTGVVQHLEFSVRAGDSFGFHLFSGGDSLPEPSRLLNTLKVENFSAPIPEPGFPAFLAIGSVLWKMLFCRKPSRSEIQS